MQPFLCVRPLPYALRHMPPHSSLLTPHSSLYFLHYTLYFLLCLSTPIPGPFPDTGQGSRFRKGQIYCAVHFKPQRTPGCLEFRVSKPYASGLLVSKSLPRPMPYALRPFTSHNTLPFDLQSFTFKMQKRTPD